MASARTECPECGKSTVIDLVPLIVSTSDDYFRCSSCFGWWRLPKGEDDPVTLVVPGNSNATTDHAKEED